MKFRPIVAGPLSPTNRLSNFVDLILKPLCQHWPSFIRDDLDFLNYLPDEIDEHTLLVSFDVVSLYSSIPHDLGLTAIEYWIDNYATSLPRSFSKEFILEAITLVLKENAFTSDNKYYRQLQGTAMGTKMAPTYANLVTGYPKKNLYTKYEETFGKNEVEDFIKICQRFLDDCFLLWKRSIEDLHKFHKIINNLHEKISFTMEKDESRIPFLDVLVYKEGRKLHADIFYKKTDTHQYMNFNSCHPKHTKQNIPYSLAKRICSIVSKPEVRNQRLRELEDFLKSQEYPTKLIQQGIAKAESLTTSQLRLTKDQSTRQLQTLPLVITHNPKNPQILRKIKQDLKFLNNSSKMKSILDNANIIVSGRQPKSLKKLLTRAEFSSEPSIKNVSKCNESKCGTCDILITGQDINFKNGKRWEIKSAMTCKSRHIIYVIICPKCH